MVYLLIILAMLLVVGPIFWVRPSPKERRIAEFRALAMQRGVKVEPVSLVTDEYYKKVSERNLHVADYQWVRYRRVSKEGKVGPGIRAQWTQRKDREGVFLWEPNPITTSEPDSVSQYLDEWRKAADMRFLGLEFGPRSVSLVWTEEGTKDELIQILTMLETLDNAQ
ncbi:hypothetical protein A9Q99_20655 [Gammaproteobacteria bacterium 45_16_T64]|nr:hypothetical protein A9Q99_20655 [Gammaproteobacteria bacterium 45_16_T64]